MNKKSKAPAVPNAQAITTQQQGINDATAASNRKLNNYNVSGPGGDVRWTTAPDGTMTQTTSLSPDQQTAFDAQQGTTSKLSRVADEMAGNIDTRAFGLPTNLPTRVTNLDTSHLKMFNPQDYETERQGYTDASFAAAKRLLDPQFADEERALQQRLSDQGLPITGEAYDHDMGNFRKNRDLAYTDAAFKAIAAGDARQAQAFGLDRDANQAIIQQQLADAGLRDNARNAGIEEEYQVYNAPVDRIRALYGAAPTLHLPTAPGYNGAMSGPADLSGNTWNAYSAAMEKYKQDMERKNAMMNAIAGIAGTAAKAAFI